MLWYSEIQSVKHSTSNRKSRFTIYPCTTYFIHCICFAIKPFSPYLGESYFTFSKISLFTSVPCAPCGLDLVLNALLALKPMLSLIFSSLFSHWRYSCLNSNGLFWQFFTPPCLPNFWDDICIFELQSLFWDCSLL